MASLSKTAKAYRIVFIHPGDRRRRAIYLPLTSKAGELDKWKSHIEHLVVCAADESQVPHAATVRWLGGLSDAQHGKLVKADLTDPRQAAIPQAVVTVADHAKDYMRRHSILAKWKDSTRRRWQLSVNSLIQFLGDRPIESITPRDAAEYGVWLRSPQSRKSKHGENAADTGLAENTARKRIGDCKQIFADAVELGLIPKSHFAKMTGKVKSNLNRYFFVTREMYEKCLSACRTQEWRVIIAMGRYAPVRGASELCEMTWGDVFWDQNRLRIRTPKTERYAGKEEKIVPLWPEVRRELEAYFEEPGKPAKRPHEKIFVQHLRQGKDTNLAEPFRDIVIRAGLTPWPNIFKNLRDSRCNELRQILPETLAAAISGHDVQTARDHYWVFTDADLADALERHNAETKKVAHKVAHSGGISDCLTVSQDENSPHLLSLPVSEHLFNGRPGTRTPTP
ncbi:MAG: phage integrase SAM-like domain-containing protein [Pirellulales bacterium]|nr:phage integrase SAM-like domain-containing protein [Pirellulales bacterium]